MQRQLLPLWSEKNHKNLQITGPDYDEIQEGEGEGDASDSDGDESLDEDGAGADVPFDVGNGEDSEGSDDGDDQHVPKQTRMSVDDGIALAGLKAEVLSIGRISRSSSRSSSHLSSRSSSVSSAMSIS
jgi:hypothetical protein